MGEGTGGEVTETSHIRKSREQVVIRPNENLDPCAFVLFGATGDLTRRKIVPALYSLHCSGLLPDPFVVVAFARRDKDDSAFRADMKQAITEFAPQLSTEGAEWESFSARLYYHRSNLDDSEGYKNLGIRLAELDQEHKLGGNRLFYLATPPDNFSEIVHHLGEAGLNLTGDHKGWSRLIIEKPFGYDLETAKALNQELASVFKEDQVYRIDHYLGKETVQNILVLRFANQIFEPIWNKNYIDNIQITVAETLGMEGRGNYFEKSGITRDIVQNHALQVLTLIAMEPPVSLDADSVRDEKVKVLKAIRRFELDDVARYTVRGQYGHGDKDDLVGYRVEEGVAADSQTETFAAFQFSIENWRWAGVPFYVQAGKRMPKRVTEVQIQFKAIPEVLFARLGSGSLKPNRLTIRIQPDEGASMEIISKEPGPQMNIQPVRMDFKYGSAFDTPIRDAYERLILDAVRGDASLFARNDEVEEAWSIITPILNSWHNLTCPLFPNYAAGTWGPEAAQKLLTGGRGWNFPC